MSPSSNRLCLPSVSPSFLSNSRADLKRAFSTLVIWKPAEVIIRRMKHWEIIADNLSKAGWSWGCVSAIDSNLLPARCHVNVFLIRFRNSLTSITFNMRSGLSEFYGPGDFRHRRQTDKGDSTICRAAARSDNPPASAETPTRAAQHHTALPRPPRIRADLSSSRSLRGQESERKFMLLCLAEEADVRVERVELSLRKFRVAHSLPRETWFRRLIRWSLLRWRISWTLALLDRIESRRSRRMLEALTQLSRLCRVIAAARMRHNQFFTRLSSCPPDDS